MPNQIIDLTGDMFGRWTVIGIVEGKRPVSWHCRCSCGNEAEVLSQQLREGRSKSCGCLRRDVTIERSTTHGFSRRGSVAIEYHSWAAMIQRCTNKNNPAHSRYGEVGITVSEVFMGPDGFSNFYKEVGPRPTAGHSIDRIDNSKGYVPGNVKWSTAKEQAINRNSTNFITRNGETRCVTEWAELTGLPRKTIALRLKQGWEIEKIFSTPPLRKSGPRIPKPTDIASNSQMVTSVTPVQVLG
jgi:hypothetical protein